ncbi:hypothetical protein ACI3PL_27780, partial [Lacticaseibacillus paracasei]
LSPLFGYGARTFRRGIYEIQAKYHHAHPEKLLLDHETLSLHYPAWPTRIHNDHAEIMHDLGVVGFIPYAVFMVAIIAAGVAS